MEAKKQEIEVRKIRENIIALIFPDQVSLTSTFLRPQEYYESPEFQGKIFTLDEYKEWYTKERGSFSYYTDWSGFNIPSTILEPFRKGKFDPLSEKEKHLLELLEAIPEPFYVIGLYQSSEDGKFDAVLKHETAHALFTLNSDYRKKVLREIGKYDVSALKDRLRSLGGYAESVLDDEINAFAVIFHTYKDPKNKVPRLLFPSDLVDTLEALFEEYS